MNLVCIVKFVPNVDSFQYDYENNKLIRENVRLMLNPDDACAVAFALKMKARNPETSIEVVTMAPTSVKPHMEDLLRLGIDRGTILSDPLFAGSDTYVTSKILAKYLSSLKINCILSGTHAIDGDTSHVPAQLSYCLKMNHMSGIVKIDEEQFEKEHAVIEVDTDTKEIVFEIMLPAVLSLTRESKYKLPYVRRQDIDRDVSDRLNIINNDDLGFKSDEIGLKGSPTKVVKTYTKEFNQKGNTVVRVDDEGIDTVFNFLKSKGVL